MPSITVAIGLSRPLLALGASAACARARGMQVVGHEHDAVSLLRLCQDTRAGVAITDPTLLKPDGAVMVDALVRLPTAVLLVCDGRVLDEVAALVRAGASGHLPDTIDARALTGAVRDVATGRLIIGDALTRRLLAIPERDDPRATLTRREQEILRLMAAGYTNRQIGDALILSPSTVKTHLTRIRIKLGTRGRAAAVAAAARLDLLTEPAPAGPARQPSAPGRDHWQRADERILELGTR